MNHKVNQQQRELKVKDQTIEILNEILIASDMRIKDLYERCSYLEDYNRRNNFHFSGINESQGKETCNSRQFFFRSGSSRNEQTG